MKAGFIHSLRFKLQVNWTAYTTQKALLKEIQELELQTNYGWGFNNH